MRSAGYTGLVVAALLFLIWLGYLTDMKSWVVLCFLLIVACIFGIIHSLRHINEGEPGGY